MADLDNANSILSDIDVLIKEAKKNKWISFVFSSIIIFITAAATSWIASFDLAFGIFIAALASAVFLFISFYSYAYRSINRINMVDHLNRHIPEYEESLQLVFNRKPTPLQLIQLQKISTIFNANTESGAHQSILPKFTIRFGLSYSLAIFAVIAATSFFSNYLDRNDNLSSSKNSDTTVENKPFELLDSKVSIQPPGYTRVPSSNQSDLNLEVLDGSKIEWLLSFSRSDAEYFWLGTDGVAHALTQKPDGSWSYAVEINETGFYRFAYKVNDRIANLPEVYTIEVVKDRIPKIKIQEPVRSLVEFAKNDPTQFTITALINDDYGIEQVDILASVAKGSGEAVKFRDKQFKFDTNEATEKGAVYAKTWSLPELEMEPGDEVYFHIKAKDNKQPRAQWGKSSSIIIRWLDNKVVETTAEGIQIRFIPEYFRSQRQIIIETEQLIADRADLSKDNFEDKSRDLGHSQSDLKEKYGQYLGDEIGEGPGEQFGLADGYHGGEDVVHGEASAGIEQSEHEDSEHHGSERENGGAEQHEEHVDEKPEVGHLHQEMVDDSDKSGASELIARFAHNHGSVEVGALSKRDPKTWMKMAVHEMWQAELHLMLSEPEKALPFEYKAYDYLKLARQAERIYVKRLGFEPPPVKEDRRLTGELDKILSYSLSITDKREADNQNDIIQNGFTSINRATSKKLLSKEDREHLKALSKLMLQLSETRPALISHAATVEKILTFGNTRLTACGNCIEKLNQKLWQLMSNPVSRPSPIVLDSELGPEPMNSYINLIRQIDQSEAIRIGKE
ncbi:MAG: hypothetical protein OQJ89_07720 [Kangiellaceae bacterium]|nr:hypothetical protein [Kangiellaceae bacterium]MCW8999806.1 hypothetical protein [Kangiellaceae bacterium]MCW9016834.1 hypothetical protein [Kangiellaceae bacterium]